MAWILITGAALCAGYAVGHADGFRKGRRAEFVRGMARIEEMIRRMDKYKGGPR